MAKRQPSTNNGSGLRDLLKGSKKADWTKVDAESIQAAIAAAARAGGAIRFGYSRDGGAYAMGIYGDGDPYTLYAPPDEDVQEILAKIENVFSELA